MKKNFYLFCLLFIGIVQQLMAQAPTTPASNVNFTLVEGGSMRVSWTNGNGARRIVIMRMGSAVTAIPANGVDYNASLGFGSGDAILPGQFVVYDAAGSSTSDVTGLQPGTVYHVAVFEYNGTGAATQYLTAAFATGNQATVSAPTTAATNIVFSNVIGNSMTITWTNGNGTRRLVVGRPGSAVNANPTDLTLYGSSPTFGNGAQIGTGNYVVYSSTGNSVTVTNLQPGTTYHFNVYEYNGSSLPVYLVTSPATGSQLTQSSPSIPASNPSFTLVDGASMRMNWTSGNGTRRIVVARAGSPVTAVPVNGTDYAENLNFNLAAEISPGQRVVYDNTGTGTSDISSLQHSTVYHFRVYEYDGTGAGISYLTGSFLSASQSTATAPLTPASAVVFSNVTGNSFTVGWSAGDGARRLVLIKAGSPVDADPVNTSFYSASTTFGLGSQLGTGNYTVYSSTGTSVNVTGLSPGIAYHAAVFEYNGSSTPVYNIVNPARNSQVTATSPTVPASGLNFTLVDGASMRANWTNGNGSRRIVVIRAGSAVTAVPADGVDYAENLNFNLAAEISPGERVVYDGVSTGTSDITGLLANTVYHFRVYEYNGTGASIDYLTSLFAAASQSTSSPPSTQASNINFTNVSGGTVTINWTPGSGVGRLVVARAGGAVNSDPVNLVNYSNSTVFGLGAELGTGNYSVYNGNGSNVTITSLNPGITYHFAIYEYNGNSGRVYAVPGHTGNVTTAAQPTIPSSNMSFTIVEGNSMRANWSSGNGTRRIVVIRAGAPVTAIPVNGINYAENLNFNTAAEISPGQRVVYDNTGTGTSDITGLLPNTVYHFRVYEYDGTGGGISYLTSSFASGNQSTSITPTLQTSNMTFTSVGATSITVNWTIGDGTRRILVGRQGSPVNVDPVDLTSYSGSTTFGSGAHLGSGNYALSVNTTVTNSTITNLVSGTTYHFALYEANGSSAPVYLVPGLAGSATTIGAPQVQATNAVPGNITTTSMQITWTNGSGNRRLVLMKQGSAVDANPINNTPYTANSFFGSGTQLGTGNYVVYNAIGSAVTVTNLQPNTTYHFAVFEFNDFGATSQFLLTNPARGNGTTSSALPVTFIDFTARNDKNNIKLEWSTAQEFNSSHFEIQKNAHNNSQDFITTGMVNAAGESTSRRNYSYTDQAPFEGTAWYRIRQVDRDGQFTYSKIVSVKYTPAGLIKTWLNPVQQGVFIQLTSFTANTNNEWRVYDMSGRIIHRESFGSQTIYGMLPAIAAGIYVLEVRMGDTIERIRINKMN